FEGNVVLSKGTILVRAERIVVRQDAEGYQSSTATGNPVRFRQRQDPKEGREGAWVDGEALRIEIDDRNSKIELFENARVNRDGDEVGQLHPGRPALRFLLGQRRQGVERRARARGDPAEDQPGRRGKKMKANERTGLSQLRSQRLRKRYKSRTVVQDVSLDVSSGEVVGLLGPNGAGKTTCFYMIVGL